ncbi:sensor histidine kinase [Compostimonas suwonensis]|uniref:histidine kinase n=1 Tax=Compostimonas suwonensis TaxID=1048394 RepID=A0A2M9BVJ9_9MICO|nr:HAMP domain-containing sensor histidine kinase [Compostimonas suwonensis]PJJ61973.1 two-component system OmpR family sensor kinase [Compostimonas suwonensis]
MHASLLTWWAGISLRTKITGVTVLVLTAGLAITGVGTMALLKPYLIDQIDTQLKQDAQGERLNDILKSDADGNSTSLMDDSGGSDYFMAVYDSNGKLIDHNWRDRASSTLPIIPATLTVAKGIQLSQAPQPFPIYDTSKQTSFHAVFVPVSINQFETGTVILAVSLRPAENIMAAFISIYLGFGFGIVVLGALLTRLLVTTTFGPLRDVERTAAAIADGDFSQRMPDATPNTEVGRLNRSLNTMLSRIDRAFKDRAKSIDQMRRFVGDASHELRTPLVSVRGYAELYRMGALQTPEDVAQAMERIEKEAIRMGGLVEDLLELARLDETKPLTLAPVDLVPLARDAALDAMASSPARTVSVVTSVIENAVVDPGELLPDTQELDILPTPHDRDAANAASANATGPIAFAGATLARLRSRRPKKPATAESPMTTVALKASGPETAAMVNAEENKIRQVITNLMGNAMRFTPDDSPIEIGVVVDRPSQRALLEVIDHGEGIPPQIREKIFQRFWRADTSRTRETGGSGLGLAIVSSIVAAHNGTVDVVETPGGGATFRVSLPLYGSPAAPQGV